MPASSDPDELGCASSDDSEWEPGSSSSDDSHDQEALDDLKLDIQTCIDDFQHDGTAHSFQSFDEYVDPRIHIPTYGTIGLPLSVRGAEQIARVCKNKISRGDHQSVTQTATPEILELDPSSFQLRNPKWKKYLDRLVWQALQDLGVDVLSGVQASKLLLYWPGASPKPDNATERPQELFGTLLICLPSEHSGGDVHLLHGGNPTILNTAENSQHHVSAIAWYSDVQHEVQVVKSGYRLVLMYDLFTDRKLHVHSGVMLDQSRAELAGLLRTWNQDFQSVKKLVYPLDIPYDKENLRQKDLDGCDVAKARLVDSVCRENGFLWFLCSAHGFIKRDPDEPHTLHVETFYTPGGHKLEFGVIDNSHEELLAVGKDFWDREFDSDEEDEEIRHMFTPMVLVLYRIPNAVREFDLDPSYNPADLRNFFGVFRDLRLVAVNPEIEECRKKAFRSIMKKAIQHISDSEINRPVSTFPNFHVQYRRVFRLVADYCYETGLQHLVRMVLMQMMHGTEWTSYKELRNIAAYEVSRGDFGNSSETFKPWLMHPPYITTFYSVNQIRIALELLQPHLGSSSFDKWKKSCLKARLMEVDSYNESDAIELVDLAFGISPDTYFDVIVKTLLNNIDRDGLAKFLCELGCRCAKESGFRNSIIIPTYQKVLSATSASFIPTLGELTRSPNHDYPDYLGYSRRMFLEILDHAMSFGLHKETLRLVDQLPDLPSSDASFWEQWDTLFAFIQDYVSILEKYKNSNVVLRSRKFIGSAISQPARAALDARPLERGDWNREGELKSRYSCNCGPCLSLIQFLADPHQVEGRFTYKVKTRTHLRRRLNTEAFKFRMEGDREPLTVIIQKTNSEFDGMFAKWKRDVSLMRSAIKSLKTDFLGSLLGDEIAALPEIVRTDVDLRTWTPATKETGN